MAAIITEYMEQNWVLLNRVIFQQIKNLGSYLIEDLRLEEHHILGQNVSDCDASEINKSQELQVHHSMWMGIMNAM